MNAALKAITVVSAIFLCSGLQTSIPPRDVPQPDAYIVDNDASRVLAHVGRSGLLSFLGHEHEVEAPVARGIVRLDRSELSKSNVRVEFDAAALRVTGRGEPAEDVPEVQRTMERDVLEIDRFPRIVFASRSIEVVATRTRQLQLQITGDLDLHGVTRRQAVDVTVALEPDSVTATGTMEVRQTDFGIELVQAGAGTVRAKDEVAVRFTLVAVPTDSPASAHQK